jgi:hypothetical protein
MNRRIGSTKNMELEFFKKENIPLGRSIKINLKISDASFNTFKAFKIRQGCKTSKEVFNFIYCLAKTIEEPFLRSEKDSRNGTISESQGESMRWHSFTVDDNALSLLNALAKSIDISIHQLLDETLRWVGLILTQRKNEDTFKKYEEKKEVLDKIGEIWGQVSELRSGFDYVFKKDYDNVDPKNYNCWFANIEGGLQELETLVPELFDELSRPEEIRDEND